MDSDYYQQALSLQNAGRYREAIGAASEISEPAWRACILIDSGTGARKQKAVREGVTLLECLLKDGLGAFSRASVLYSIANGYSSLYKLRKLRGVHVVPPNDDDLRKAKSVYREALTESANSHASLRSQILINYGNCLSDIGRSFEAISAFGEALELDPLNGMASGNLGVELERVADITGRYRHHYILEAHKALTQACSPQMDLSYGGLEAHQAFHRSLEHLQGLIDAHKAGLEPLRKVSLSTRRSTENRYLEFCLEHGLFLNAWVGDQTVTPALSDEIAYGPIVTSLDDTTTVPELLRILNEVKEAYVTARYLFFLSTTESRVLDHVSGITSYFDAMSTDLHGLYLGLCKSAYVRSFDVLDKVARIVNVYFSIGKRNDYFWSVFAEKQSRGQAHEIRYVARPAIVAKRNYSLYALSDLCIDYFESEQVGFKTIDSRRNLITHDYLAISASGKPPVEAGSAQAISVAELYRQTEVVLGLAKNAILYAVSAVHIAEEMSRTSGLTAEMRYEQSPGHPAVVVQRTTQGDVGASHHEPNQRETSKTM